LLLSKTLAGRDHRRGAGLLPTHGLWGPATVRYLWSVARPGKVILHYPDYRDEWSSLDCGRASDFPLSASANDLECLIRAKEWRLRVGRCGRLFPAVILLSRWVSSFRRCCGCITITGDAVQVGIASVVVGILLSQYKITTTVAVCPPSARNGA